MALAPPWAFSAEAIDGIGDTHLAKGIHIRALPSPSAGLPATPLFVYRALAQCRRDRPRRAAYRGDLDRQLRQCADRAVPAHSRTIR